ncbi:hypothetical protein [Variovorax sp. UMC13]|uniref:hypothetical protein n=1 Tax=Variovorax sp. UMC13 TaxID=1862326 RepID=UPI0015FED45B|nr:hypothetical protein [Variovorax sp. UMC13]MBB1601766.1 hypothetical protein [Variovorax sp. UMC13]
MSDYFRSVSVRITEPVRGRFYWAIIENLGVASMFNELAAAIDPYDTWEEARQAGVAELKRREPQLWAMPPEG